jgi:hypothetical protein
VSAQATVFDIANTNGKITFAFAERNVTYDDVVFANDTWHFKRLGIQFCNGDFSIAVKDSNISLTHYNPMSQESKPQAVFHAGYVRYLVEGIGEQRFNLHFVWDVPVHWTVKIDDVERPEGNGWTFSNGWLIVKGATNKVVAACIVDEDPNQAPNQAPIRSGGNICYPLPGLKANILFERTISFREMPIFNPNATFKPPASTPYPYAYFFRAKEPNLQNSPWILFSGIVIGDDDFGTARIAVTAKNSNITFTYIGATNHQLTEHRARTDCWLNFSVTEGGQQSIALYSAITGGGNMTVIIDNVVRKAGDGWRAQKDESGYGWLTITDAKNTVSISSADSYYFGPSLVFGPDYTTIIPVILGIVIFLMILFVLLRRKPEARDPKHWRIVWEKNIPEKFF